MITVPAVIPVTTPVLLTVAIVALLLVQVPPETVSTNVIEAEVQTLPGPDITPAEGELFTVIARVATAVLQAPVTVYDMSALPEVTPNTTPDAFIEATLVLLLLHVPPVTAFVSVVLLPVQTTELPEIVPAVTGLLTTTVCVANAVPQLPETVYEISTVPVAKPVTLPVVLTVAIDVLLLLHVPPLTASVKVMLLPTQTTPGPEMVPADADVPTETLYVTRDVPQLLVMV